jgi:hypothetical protein
LFIQDALRAQKNEDKWVFGSGWCSDKIGDKTNFVTLKKNEGGDTFGDNGRSKIVGKGTLNIENGRAKFEKVLCVEKLKHNLLSVSHNLLSSSPFIS